MKAALQGSTSIVSILLTPNWSAELEPRLRVEVSLSALNTNLLTWASSNALYIEKMLIETDILSNVTFENAASFA